MSEQGGGYPRTTLAGPVAEPWGGKQSGPRGIGRAGLLSLALHAAALWLLAGPAGVLVFRSGMSEEESRKLSAEFERRIAEARAERESERPLVLKFIDIPDEPEAPNPDARVGSDRSRRARSQPRPADAPPPDNPDPYSRGTTPQMVLYEAAKEPSDSAPVPGDGEEQPPPGGGDERPAGEGKGADAGSRPVASGAAGTAAGGGAGGGRSGTGLPAGAGSGRRLSGTRISPSEIAEVFDNPGGVASAQVGRLSFDSAAIDWGPYAREMSRAIRRAWLERIPPAFYQGGQRGVVQVSFRIQRDGAVSEISILDSFGVRVLADGRGEVGPGIRPFEVTVEETLQAAEIPPLPSHFPDPSVGITAAFCYGIPCR